MSIFGSSNLYFEFFKQKRNCFKIFEQILLRLKIIVNNSSKI